MTPGFDPHFIFSISYQATVLLMAPGIHWLQIWAGEELLAERVLSVQLVGQIHQQR